MENPVSKNREIVRRKKKEVGDTMRLCLKKE